MDDFSVTSLSESKNEWCARLVGIFTPAVIAGLRSIFEEAVTLCKDNNEDDKYLLTFQTFLRRVPKWNKTIIETEQKRIAETSGCGYLEDLITCVHIIQLKALTCVRVGQEQKKVDVKVPSVEDFVHKVYIATARKVYANVYLFDADAVPLQIQKHNRELELIVRECIMDTIRASMPVDDILRAYLAETEETEIHEVIEHEQVSDENDKDADKADADKADADKAGADKADADNDISHSDVEQVSQIQETQKINNMNTAVTFSDVDKAMNSDGIEVNIDAPKTISRLDEISKAAYDKRMSQENDDEKLKIGDELRLEIADICDLNRPLQVDTNPIVEIENLSFE